MHLIRKMSVFLLFAGQLMPAAAQNQKPRKEKAPAAVTPLFTDLPIDNASGNSVPGSGESAGEKIKKNIHVTGSLTKSTCYVGEPVLLTYQLYSALQSKSVIAVLPALSNFNAEERPLNDERPGQKKMDDKNYRVFTIWQVQLNPFLAGSLHIDPLSVNNEVSYSSPDNKMHSYSGLVSSNQLGLVVLPLPDYRGPEGFSGGIGKFRIRAVVSSVRITAGENDSLHLEIEGAGNLNAVKMPAVVWPLGFECFLAREKKWAIAKNAFPPAGKKMVDIPFVAHKEGRYTIPSVRLSYFDPALKGYAEAESGPVAVEILPALARGRKSPAGGPGGGAGLSAAGSAGAGKAPGYLWVIWAAVGLGGGAVIFWWLRKRSPTPKPAADPGPAPDPAAEAKKELELLDGMPDKEQYIIGVKMVLSHYLREKFHIDDASGDVVADQVYQCTGDKALAGQVRDVYFRCSKLLYSPSRFEEGDTSLADLVHRVVERSEIH